LFVKSDPIGEICCSRIVGIQLTNCPGNFEMVEVKVVFDEIFAYEYFGVTFCQIDGGYIKSNGLAVYNLHFQLCSFNYYVIFPAVNRY